jgi:AcrR family transcriptional regulator
MVEISAAAGHRNKSAVAYHFDGRDGLIEAVYGEIQSFLEPRYAALLDELEARPTSRLSIYEIGLALNAPLFALYASEPDGNATLKTLARLGHDSPPGEHSMYRRFLSETFNRFALLISEAAPRKPLGQINFHLAHYRQATINGLALTDRWQELNFRSDPDLQFELLLSYADYVAGGISGSESGRPRYDAERWRRASRP